MIVIAKILLLSMTVPFVACSSSYTPQHSGRKISTVWTGGSLAYHRDGQVFEAGYFGGGLLDAVSGVPKAEAAARTRRRRGIVGTVLTVGGFVCASIAMSLSSDDVNGLSERGAVAVGACSLGIAAGIGTSISAIPYQYDAINIYNDAVSERSVTLPEGRPVSAADAKRAPESSGALHGTDDEGS